MKLLLLQQPVHSFRGATLAKLGFILVLSVVSFCTSAFAQNNVGIGTTTPVASALLDLTSSSKGLLIPRMTTAQKLAVSSPATGLLVFDNTLNTFYYYNSTAWVPFLSSASAGWLTTGNSGTSSATNFVGTTDAQDLVFKSNSAEGMRLSAALNFGIGTTLPTSILHTVASGAKVLGYTGNLLTNTATSSTAAITKYGTEILSTGTWNGAAATNIGLHVNATGGNLNYSAIFEGGNVGVNTTTPATKLDIAGDVAIRYGGFGASNGLNNNIAIGAVSFVRITGPTAAFTITGIAGGSDGKVLKIYNSTSQQITIANENTNSSAANRITTLNSTGDIVITGKGTAELIYSSADSRWLVTASSTTVSTSTTGVICKKKASDQSVTGSTTLVNDNDLVIAIPANDSMIIDGYLHVNSGSSTPGIQYSFTIPAGATMDIGAVLEDVTYPAPESAFLTSSGTSTGAIPFGPGDVPIIFHGVVVTGATGGNIQLKWAQGTSNGTATTIRKLSFMKGTFIR